MRRLQTLTTGPKEGVDDRRKSLKENINEIGTRIGEDKTDRTGQVEEPERADNEIKSQKEQGVGRVTTILYDDLYDTESFSHPLT